jgi:hypothetical protein
MSDQMPIGDLVDDTQATGPWTCPRCGRENKASWRQCPACESDRAGKMPAQREPARVKNRTNPIYLILGLLILVALVVGAVWVAEPVWTWVVEQWTTFIAWVDART